MTQPFKIQFIYLHGFNSGFNPAAQKIKELANLSGYKVSGFTTNYLDAGEVTRLEKSIAKSVNDFDGETILVGTSLGGYFARYFGTMFNLRIVLLNPAVMPYHSLMSAIGLQTNYFTAEEIVVTHEAVSSLLMYEEVNVTPDALMILAYDDEVIPYELPRDAYPECKVVLTLGGHRMESLNSVSAEITAFINRLPASDTIL